MDWLKLLQAAISLTLAFTTWLERKGIIDAATTALLKDNYESSLEKLKAVRLARSGVPSDPDSLQNDSNNRDPD